MGGNGISSISTCQKFVRKKYDSISSGTIFFTIFQEGYYKKKIGKRKKGRQLEILKSKFNRKESVEIY
jgi:hypothetical protein